MNNQPHEPPKVPIKPQQSIRQEIASMIAMCYHLEGAIKEHETLALMRHQEFVHAIADAPWPVYILELKVPWWGWVRVGRARAAVPR
jgi:hypothetical protein